MAKRKLEGDLPHRPSKRRPDALIRETIAHGQKQLLSALKLAKGFERQKLGRRKSTAVKDNNEEQQTRIDSEIEALKNMDLSLVATNYMYKLVLKEKAMATHPLLPEEMKTIRKFQDQASMNVVARLYKANPVSQAVPGVMKAVRRAFGVDAKSASSGGQDTKSKQEKATRTQEKEPSNGKHTQDEEPIDSTEADADADEEDSFNGFDTSSNTSLSSEALSTAMDHLSERLASPSPAPSDSQDTPDLTSIPKTQSQAEASLAALRARILSGTFKSSTKPTRDVSLSASPSLSQSPSSSRSSSPNPSSTTLSKPQQEQAKPSQPKPKSSSAFLPSLTQGYLSDSESSASDDPEINARRPPKKNRRGQRARQMIWEKKFGSGARHLQEPGPESQPNGKSDPRGKARGGKTDGWDARKGAVGARSGGAVSSRGRGLGRGGRGGSIRGGSIRGGGSRGREDRQSGAGFDRGGEKKKLADEKKAEQARRAAAPLHPSWVAAMKRKEGAPGAVGFAGKKVVFD